MLPQLAVQAEILCGGGGGGDGDDALEFPMPMPMPLSSPVLLVGGVGGAGDSDGALELPIPPIWVLRFTPLESEGATKKLKEDKARKVIKLDVFMAGGLLFWWSKTRSKETVSHVR
jgi:hypothetical protein